MNEREIWKKYARKREEEAGACPDIVDLAAYIDGTLAEEERERIERHLSRCPACLDAVLAMKNLETGPLRLDDTLRAQKVWEACVAPERTPKRMYGTPIALRVAASVLFLLIALGGYRAGVQTCVSADLTASDPIAEEMDEMAGLFDESWDLFDGEAIR
jgi:anti-sigma factor RsiW